MHDSDHTIDNVNQALCRILGRTKDELIGKKCYQIFHGTDVPIAACPIERSRQTLRRETAERFEPALNKWLAVSVSPILDDVSHSMRLVHTVRDITDRKQVEESLREAQERLALAVNAGQIGIFDWKLLTDEVAWSQQQEVIFGYPPGAAATTLHSHRDWADRVHPDDLPWVEQRIRQAMAERTPYQLEHRVAWPDGSIHWVAAQGRVYYDAEGRATRRLGTVIDITDRKRAEEALRASEERHHLEELKQAQEILKQAHDEQLQRHQAELAHVARLGMMGEMAASLRTS